MVEYSAKNAMEKCENEMEINGHLYTRTSQSKGFTKKSSIEHFQKFVNFHTLKASKAGFCTKMLKIGTLKLNTISVKIVDFSLESEFLQK